MVDNVLSYRKRVILKLGIDAVIENQYVLDLGCGVGGDAVLLNGPAKKVLGIDVQPHPEWDGSRSNNLDFLVADTAFLPIKSEQFNVVFIKDVLHHLSKLQTAIEEIKRVTKGGGQIIIIEANRYNPIFYVHMTLMLKHQHFTRGYFENLIKSNFRNFRFRCIETRVYPTKNNLFMGLFHMLESFVEKTPFISKFSTYNVALIRKEK